MGSCDSATNSPKYKIGTNCLERVFSAFGFPQSILQEFTLLINIGNNHFKTSRESVSFGLRLILTPTESIFNSGRNSACRLDVGHSCLCILCIDPRCWCDATSCCSSTDWIYFFLLYRTSALLMLPTSWCRPSVLWETWRRRLQWCHSWRAVGIWRIMKQYLIHSS